MKEEIKLSVLKIYRALKLFKINENIFAGIAFLNFSKLSKLSSSPRMIGGYY
jgi:hypothetical protein